MHARQPAARRRAQQAGMQALTPSGDPMHETEISESQNSEKCSAGVSKSPTSLKSNQQQQKSSASCGGLSLVLYSYKYRLTGRMKLEFVDFCQFRSNRHVLRRQIRHLHRSAAEISSFSLPAAVSRREIDFRLRAGGTIPSLKSRLSNKSPS